MVQTGEFSFENSKAKATAWRYARSIFEITFRTEAAAEAIRTLTREMPDMTVGAGTVVTKAQADAAIAAGAKFIVSPGFQPELVAYVREKGIAMCPGTATPGEMEQAMSLGLDAVKFFPRRAERRPRNAEGALRAVSKSPLYADRRRDP